jgi:hypothetical protein
MQLLHVCSFIPTPIMVIQGSSNGTPKAALHAGTRDTAFRHDS